MKLPKALHGPATQAACRVKDAVDTVTGRRDPLIPPTRLMFDGPRSVAEFRANGEEFLRHYRELGGLRPDEDVLDVGSGIGRKTLPLTAYLSPSARYEGFDINPSGIAWCREHITARHPNFGFTFVDLGNRHYNPVGGGRAEDFAFPYGDAEFDFVTVGSVFTHLLSDALLNYVGQIARVLRPGGRCLMTVFLLDEEARRGVREGRSRYPFVHGEGHWRVADPDDPEMAIAFDEGWFLERVAERGLRLRVPIQHGSWSGRDGARSFQDIVVVEKPAADGAGASAAP